MHLLSSKKIKFDKYQIHQKLNETSNLLLNKKSFVHKYLLMKQGSLALQSRINFFFVTCLNKKLAILIEWDF